MQNTSQLPKNVKIISSDISSRFAFSICTLMTRPDQYTNMVQSYRDAGFGDDCEFLCIDNSCGNIFDGFSGYNAFLSESVGQYIILTHQDVDLCFDDRTNLENQLQLLTAKDRTWAVCGNAGGVKFGDSVARISDPHGENRTVSDLPRRVQALDENFIVVRRSANLCLSGDLTGYHLYGSDLCVIADVLGYSSYVIDFHLRHLSGGTISADFRDGADAFVRKYARAFRSRWVPTTVTDLFLSGTTPLRSIATSRIGRILKIAQKRR